LKIYLSKTYYYIYLFKIKGFCPTAKNKNAKVFAVVSWPFKSLIH